MGLHLKWIIGVGLLFALGCEPSAPPAKTPASAPPELPAHSGPSAPSAEPVKVDLVEAKAIERVPLRLIQDQQLKTSEAKLALRPFKLEASPEDAPAAWVLRHALFTHHIAVLSPLQGAQERFILYDLKTGLKLSERQGRFISASDSRGWLVYEVQGQQSELTVETLDPASTDVVKLQGADKQPVKAFSALADEQLWILAPAHGGRQTLIGSWAKGKPAPVELGVEITGRINDLKAQGDKLVVELVAGVGRREEDCERLELSPDQARPRCLEQPKPNAWRFEGKRSEAPTLRSPQGQVVTWRAPEGCTLDINAHLVEPTAAMLRCLPKKDQAPQWWLWTPEGELRLPITQRQLTRGELKSTLVFTHETIVDLKRAKLLDATTLVRALEGTSAARQTLVETAPELGVRKLWQLNADEQSLRLLSTYEDCPVGAQLQQDGLKGSVIVISCRDLRKNTKAPMKHHWTERLDLASGQRVRISEGFPEALHEDGTLILSDRAQHQDLHISQLWVLAP